MSKVKVTRRYPDGRVEEETLEVKKKSPRKPRGNKSNVPARDKTNKG